MWWNIFVVILWIGEDGEERETSNNLILFFSFQAQIILIYIFPIAPQSLFHIM